MKEINNMNDSLLLKTPGSELASLRARVQTIELAIAQLQDKLGQLAQFTVGNTQIVERAFKDLNISLEAVAKAMNEEIAKAPNEPKKD